MAGPVDIAMCHVQEAGEQSFSSNIQNHYNLSCLLEKHYRSIQGNTSLIINIADSVSC